MKKIALFSMAILLIVAILAGCDTSENTEIVTTEPTASAETQNTTEAPTEEVTEDATEAPTEVITEAPTEAAAEDTEDDVSYEGDASSYYIDKVYAEQIARYYTALSEKWEEDKYFENGMSALPSHYYEGNPLENVGFGFEDLDNDGHWELIIGAIQGAEQDPSVFEIWTLVDDKPVMLAQGGSGNRYVLQYVEEDNMWYVANEASNNASSHATFYLMLCEGELQIMQGIAFDAEADAENPWFMTYDMDWDVSNDEPIDEDMADALLETNRSHYTALEYFPYIFYK